MSTWDYNSLHQNYACMVAEAVAGKTCQSILQDGLNAFGMTNSDWRGGSHLVKLSEDLNSSGNQYDLFMQQYLKMEFLNAASTEQMEEGFDSRTTSSSGTGGGQYAFGMWVDCPQGSNPFNMP